MSNIVSRDEPLQIGIEIRQGEKVIGAKAVLDLRGWPSLTSEERAHAFANTLDEITASIKQELTFE